MMCLGLFKNLVSPMCEFTAHWVAYIDISMSRVTPIDYPCTHSCTFVYLSWSTNRTIKFDFHWSLTKQCTWNFSFKMTCSFLYCLLRSGSNCKQWFHTTSCRFCNSLILTVRDSLELFCQYLTPILIENLRRKLRSSGQCACRQLQRSGSNPA